MKKNVLIVGAGGVAHVAAHKCIQNREVLEDIHLASRSISKCEAIIASVRDKQGARAAECLRAHVVDATDPASVVRLIHETGAQIVINLASAFVNMHVLEACIRTGAAYLDTAIHEDPGRSARRHRGMATSSGSGASAALRPGSRPSSGSASIQAS